MSLSQPSQVRTSGRGDAGGSSSARSGSPSGDALADNAIRSWRRDDVLRPRRVITGGRRTIGPLASFPHTLDRHYDTEPPDRRHRPESQVLVIGYSRHPMASGRPGESSAALLETIACDADGKVGAAG